MHLGSAEKGLTDKNTFKPCNDLFFCLVPTLSFDSPLQISRDPEKFSREYPGTFFPGRTTSHKEHSFG